MQGIQLSDLDGHLVILIIHPIMIPGRITVAGTLIITTGIITRITTGHTRG